MEGVPSVNYFTCTLAEAAQRTQIFEPSVSTFDNVLDLIEKQAKRTPDSPAVGFADFTKPEEASPPSGPFYGKPANGLPIFPRIARVC